MKKRGHPIHGWIFLDKPMGMTSAQAVAAIKRLYHPQKIGHAGPLDPLATGVLPLALGEATKTVPYCMDADKEYEFTVRWGEATDTLDREGVITATHPHRPALQDIQNILPSFLGIQAQLPPVYSALKVNGKRACDLARSGETPILQARQITIHAISLITAEDIDHASFRATCSKGTYVRVLAQDIALRLGTIAHIVRLRRTRVGRADLMSAYSLETLASTPLTAVLQPVSAVLDDIPAIAITQEQSTAVRMGKSMVLAGAVDNQPVVYVHQDNDLVAFGALTAGVFQPQRVLIPQQQEYPDVDDHNRQSGNC